VTWAGLGAALGPCGAPGPVGKEGEVVRRNLHDGCCGNRIGGVMAAHLWTNGRWRADDMQGGGGLLYLCNQRTDRAAWVVARACGEWDSLVRW
jgi:hypothetical protein